MPKIRSDESSTMSHKPRKPWSNSTPSPNSVPLTCETRALPLSWIPSAISQFHLTVKKLLFLPKCYYVIIILCFFQRGSPWIYSPFAWHLMGWGKTWYSFYKDLGVGWSIQNNYRYNTKGNKSHNSNKCEKHLKAFRMWKMPLHFQSVSCPQSKGNCMNLQQKTTIDIQKICHQIN